MGLEEEMGELEGKRVGKARAEGENDTVVLRGKIMMICTATLTK